MLSETNKEKITKMRDYYNNEGRTIVNASEEYTQEQLDNERNNIIPTIKELINGFLEDNVTLDNFKTEIDGLNKRHRLWGFKGINGQMFFNMLYNVSLGAGMKEELVNVLKRTIRMPNNIEEAKNKIDQLSSFALSLSNYVQDGRQAPRVGSTNFFITYFWQIQNSDKWPIYYSSMINALQDNGIWSPTGELTYDYEEFFKLNNEIKNFIEEKENREIKLWDVEHTIWVWAMKEEGATGEVIEEMGSDSQMSTLPVSFIPPIVSVIPFLAQNNDQIRSLCEDMGVSVEKSFEERITILFRMLGYEVRGMGQGYGRVPDGIAISNEYHYALIFDTKVRQDGYSLGTDDRAIKEYINRETEILKRQGVRNIYFIIISSFFRGDYDDVIRNIKMETDIREIIFIEADALMTILEQKLRNSNLDLGPRGIQMIFAQSGVVSDNDVKEFLTF